MLPGGEAGDLEVDQMPVVLGRHVGCDATAHARNMLGILIEGLRLFLKHACQQGPSSLSLEKLLLMSSLVLADVGLHLPGLADACTRQTMHAHVNAVAVAMAGTSK